MSRCDACVTVRWLCHSVMVVSRRDGRQGSRSSGVMVVSPLQRSEGTGCDAYVTLSGRAWAEQHAGRACHRAHLPWLCLHCARAAAGVVPRTVEFAAHRTAAQEGGAAGR
eukprot:3790425-Pyramimonas_sp.AAC.1